MRTHIIQNLHILIIIRIVLKGISEICRHEEHSVTQGMVSIKTHYRLKRTWRALCIRAVHPKQKCYGLKEVLRRCYFVCLLHMHPYITDMIQMNFLILSHLLNTKHCLSCSSFFLLTHHTFFFICTIQ